MGLPAGGHGGIVFNANGTLDKPTNPVEVQFLQTVFGVGPLGNVVYNAYQPFAQLAPWLPSYYGWGIVNGDPVVRLGNIAHGLVNPLLMDVKIGARTASKRELVHSGSSAWHAFWKKRKMSMADWWLESEARGFRIIHYTNGPADRTATARADPRVAIAAIFNNNNLRQAARGQITNLAQAVLNTDAFFVASSLLFATDGAQVRMKLIDFGHSHVGGAGQTNTLKYQQQFVAGLMAFRHYL